MHPAFVIDDLLSPRGILSICRSGGAPIGNDCLGATKNNLLFSWGSFVEKFQHQEDGTPQDRFSVPGMWSTGYMHG